MRLIISICSRGILILCCLVLIPEGQGQTSFDGFESPISELDLTAYTGSPNGPYTTVWHGRYDGVDRGEGKGMHPGADIAKPAGTLVKAIAVGRIIRVLKDWDPNGEREDQKSDWGNHVVIQHDLPNGTRIFSSYAHLSEVDANLDIDDEVVKGQFIGHVGNTGKVRGKTGVHLHFQIDKDRGGNHPYWLRSTSANAPPPVNTSDDWVLQYTINPIPLVRDGIILNDISISQTVSSPSLVEIFIYNILNLSGNAVKVRLGASIRPTGPYKWTDNPDNDRVVEVVHGFSDHSRIFVVPQNSQLGLYDVAWTLATENGSQWYARSEGMGLLTIEAPLPPPPPPGVPAINVFPTSFDFGSVTVGSSSQTNFTIQNTGNATLTIIGIDITPGDFDLDLPAPPLDIAPGDSSAFRVFFTPSGPGTHQAAISIISNAPSSPTLVSVSGIGASELPHLTARAWAGTSAIDGTIYIIGGAVCSTCAPSGQTDVATVEAYDAGSNSVSSKAPLQVARSSLSVSEVNGKLYAIGGTSGCCSQPIGLVEEYDPAADAWSLKSTSGGARWKLTTAAVGGKIYAIGGGPTGNQNQSSNANEEYDPVTDTWTTKAPMPTSRYGLASGVITNQIYAVGGFSVFPSSGLFSILEVYDPSTDTWTTGPPMPTPRMDLAAAVVNGRLYAIGGWDTNTAQVLAAVEEYDPITNTWETKSPMPTARVGLAAVAVDGNIYAIGGHDGQQPISTIEVYDPSTDSWTPVSSLFTQLSFAQTDLAVGGVVNSIVAGSSTADPNADLAVTNGAIDAVSVLLGSGDVTFSAPGNFPTASGPSSLATGDFNVDGRTDLGVGYGFSNEVSILLGNGDGSSGPHTEFPTGGGIFPNKMSIAPGDFNADGRLDVAVAMELAGGSILLGNGDGTLGPPVTFGTAPEPDSLAMGDFNGDGRRDLVSTSGIFPEAAIVLGNGDGTFGAPATVATDAVAGSVIARDFNNDGRLDLGVVNFVSPGSVGILLGNGDGTFGTPANYTSGGDFPLSATSGDFNRDGKIDLAVGQHNGIWILVGNGNGSFGPPTDLAIPEGALSLTPADLNGDGKLDLAAVPPAGVSVFVLLNTSQ